MSAQLVHDGEREVGALKAEGRIEFVGPAKTGYYQLAEVASA